MATCSVPENKDPLCDTVEQDLLLLVRAEI